MFTHAHTRITGLGVGAAAGSLALSLAGPAAHAAEPTPRAGLAVDGRVAPRPTAVPSEYTVADGDTVSAIAARFGLRTQDVLDWNGLAWDSIIRPGQALRLTAPVGMPAAVPAAASAPAAPSAAAAQHTVVAGDTISAIAATTGTTIPAVLAANGLTWDSIIYPGQVLVVPAAMASETPAASVAPASPASPATAIPPLELDAEQLANARVIIAVGHELGVPDRGIAIALGTAMQESWLRNLDWGDRDSLGLFQQRPSTGWGTPEQVRDPDRAARAFFGGAGDPNGTLTRGLLDVPPAGNR
jgi:LysM repeat protein